VRENSRRARRRSRQPASRRADNSRALPNRNHGLASNRVPRGTQASAASVMVAPAMIATVTIAVTATVTASMTSAVARSVTAAAMTAMAPAAVAATPLGPAAAPMVIAAAVATPIISAPIVATGMAPAVPSGAAAPAVAITRAIAAPVPARASPAVEVPAVASASPEIVAGRRDDHWAIGRVVGLGLDEYRLGAGRRRRRKGDETRRRHSGEGQGCLDREHRGTRNMAADASNRPEPDRRSLERTGAPRVLRFAQSSGGARRSRAACASFMTCAVMASSPSNFSSGRRKAISWVSITWS